MTDVTITNSVVAVTADRGDDGPSVTVQVNGPTTVAASTVGIQGPSGGGGSAAYTYTQSPAAMVWTIDHNLGFRPTVTVFSESGDEVRPNIQNPTVNRTTIGFSEAFAGTARLT